MESYGRRLGAALVAAMLAAAACGVDEAESLYLSALRGESAGMSRAEQIERITRAIALAPDRPHYYETRAIYRIDRREFSDALGDVDRAITLGDRPYLRFLRGLVLCQSQRPEQSIDDFDLAIRQQPTNLQFYRGRGLALAELGRFEAALADGEHLVAAAGHMAESHYVRGRALQGLGRHADAVRDFTTAIAIRPDLVYPLTARAASYAALADDRAPADLAAAAAAVRDAHRRCALCVDPFRY